MKHTFKTSPEVAHALTKAKKKEEIYFRSLTRTDNVKDVICEVTEKGYEYITKEKLNVKWEEKA